MHNLLTTLDFGRANKKGGGGEKKGGGGGEFLTTLSCNMTTLFCNLRVKIRQFLYKIICKRELGGCLQLIQSQSCHSSPVCSEYYIKSQPRPNPSTSKTSRIRESGSSFRFQ